MFQNLYGKSLRNKNMEIGKQISTGDFLIKGSKEEMALFKELFDKAKERTIKVAQKKESRKDSSVWNM